MLKRSVVCVKGKPTAKNKKRKTAKKSTGLSHEDLLVALLKQEGLTGFKRQFAFNKPRKHLADIAFVELGVLIEVEGGLWVYGRHNRPQGFMDDCEKYNAAAIKGYRLIRIPTPWIDKKPDYVIQVIKDALESAE